MNKINTSLAVLAISLGLSANAMADDMSKNNNGYKTGPDAEQSTNQSAPKTSVGTAIDDSVVTTKVKSALLAEPSIKSLGISVETQKGQVELSGAVESDSQAKRAVQIASNVGGVKSVVNKLNIK